MCRGAYDLAAQKGRYWKRGPVLHRRACVSLFVVYLFLALAGCSVGKATPAAATPASLTPTSSALYSDVTSSVQRGRVARVLELDGRVSPVGETQLSFAAPGYVKWVYVKARDQVHTGDILAELEVGNLPSQIAQAEVELELSRQALNEAQEQRADAIASAELGLDMAEARLQSAKDANAHEASLATLAVELVQEELASLQARGPVYAAAVTSARVGLSGAQERQARAQQEYNEAKERPWEPAESIDAYARELQAAKWATDVAQAQYAQALAEQAAYEHELEVQRIVVEQAEAEAARVDDSLDPLLALEVERTQLLVDQAGREISPGLSTAIRQAQLSLDHLRSQLDQSRIRSPVDGQVVSLSVYPGLLVEPLKPMVIVADPTALEVRATASAEEMASLTEGQPVSVAVGARAERTYEGSIDCLPYPYGTCGAGEREDSNSAVRVKLEADPSDLQVGLPALVTVVLEAREAVLWVPPEAIRTLQGGSFVTVQEGARQHRVEVEIGIAGEDRVEIVNGLEEGQLVVVPD